MRIYTPTVTRVSRPTVGFVRLRLEHPDFGWTGNSLDTYIKVLTGRVWEEQPWTQELLVQCRATDELNMRTYTIARQGEGFIEVDCAVHDAPGDAPGMQLFVGAQVGDRVSIVAPDPGEETWTPANRAQQPQCAVVAVDETALPAAVNVVASRTSQGFDTTVVAVISNAEDAQYVPQDYRTRYVLRRDFDGPDDAALHEAVASAVEEELLALALKAGTLGQELDVSEDPQPLQREDGTEYIWDESYQRTPLGVCVMGETMLVKRVRQVAKQVPGVTREGTSAMGYWRRGVSG